MLSINSIILMSDQGIDDREREDSPSPERRSLHGRSSMSSSG